MGGAARAAGWQGHLRSAASFNKWKALSRQRRRLWRKDDATVNHMFGQVENIWMYMKYDDARASCFVGDLVLEEAEVGLG